MSSLTKKERFKVLEMVSEIASEAAKNEKVDSMIEFQNDFIESLYNTMVGLLEDDDEGEDREGDSDLYEDDEDEEDEDLGNRAERAASSEQPAEAEPAI